MRIRSVTGREVGGTPNNSWQGVPGRPIHPPRQRVDDYGPYGCEIVHSCLTGAGPAPSPAGKRLPWKTP
jgi:hypothetical protein